MSAPRVRFAPSPTGSLHLGNARTALFNWLVARHHGGTFVLRVEDTDVDREQEGSEASILEDLRWMGLLWDEGPDVGGPHGPYRQSERSALYRQAAERLLEEEHAFRCFCPARPAPGGRESVHAAEGGGSGHRDPCRGLPRGVADERARGGEASAIRFRVPDRDDRDGPSVRFFDRLRGEVAIALAQVPDGVLIRHDGRPTYNFGVVVDDAAMKIDLVLRGDDHLTNTSIQVLLYRALGEAAPEFAHVPMVLGGDGERLSKRHGATSVGSWRQRGVPPEALLNSLVLLGWSPPDERTIVPIADLVAAFELERVGRSPAVFDPVKLMWISAQYVHALPAERLAEEVGEQLVAAGRIQSVDRGIAPTWIAGVAEFLRSSLACFEQVGGQVEPLFHPGGALDQEARALLAEPGAAGVVAALAVELKRTTPLDLAGWNALRAAVARETGAKGKTLFQPLRIAVTGRSHGRELDRLVPLAAEGHRVLPERVPALRARADRTLEEMR